MSISHVGHAESWDATRVEGTADDWTGMAAVEEQFRRMVFNIVARNQDDHVKNIALRISRRARRQR